MGPDHKFRVERFPSGRRPNQEFLARFKTENQEIGQNAANHAAAYTEHTLSSKTFIMDSARGRRGKALVLGVGNGIDIPLEELGQQFKEVTVVDVDENAPSKRLAALDPELQKKFTLVVEDLTGMVTPLGRRLLVAESKSRNLQQFMANMANEWRAMDPSAPDFGSDYDFVCSSLITSQLGSQPHIRFSNIANQTFGTDRGIVRGPEALDYFTSLTSLSHRMHTDHLDLMRGALVPNGAAYYSDTFAEARTVIHPLTRQVVLAEDWKIMLQPDLVRTDIPQRFAILEDRGWLWNRTPPTAISPGSSFSVLAFRLQSPATT